MACTTILVGKKASYDGSTLIARNDDGAFEPKRVVIITPDKQKKNYKSKIGHLEIELPDNPLRYSASRGRRAPSADTPPTRAGR